MYASAEQREADIEAGSGRSGLELQIDLDTTAGRLGDAFEALDHDEALGRRGRAARRTPRCRPGCCRWPGCSRS